MARASRATNGEVNDEPDQDVLMTSDSFITLNLEGFGKAIQSVIHTASLQHTFNVKDLRLRMNERVDVLSIQTIEQLRKYGIAVVDYFIYKMLAKNGITMEVLIVEGRQLGTESDYMQSLFALYFCMMTRGRMITSETESLPVFLINYCGIKMNTKTIVSLLSDHDLNRMVHTWIGEVDTSKLAKPVRQRLSAGIAGFRAFNVIKCYIPENLAALDMNLARVYKVVRDVAMGGPYLEMHPFFISSGLASISVTKNLLNLILDIYTDAEINGLVKNKAIFEYPKRDSRYIQYLSWDQSTFDCFKTKVVKE